MRISNVRLSFPDLFEATKFQGQGAASFGASFLLDPEDPQVDAINKEMDRVAGEKWGAKAAGIMQTLRKGDKTALHDGDLKTYDGYAGMVYLSARSKIKPMVLDRDAKTELTEEQGKMYAGCYVNAIVDFWVQDNGYGKRVNCTIHKVQFFRDGDAFAGGTMSDEEFDDLAVDEQMEDLA